MKSPSYFVLALLLQSASSGVEVPSRIMLRYDTALVNADFPNPAVWMTFNGRSAWFLIDTGAGMHMLASWFVNVSGLQADSRLAAEIRGRDSTGRALTFRGVPAFTARLEDGGVVPLGFAAVSDFPADFEQAGIAGVISPQLLAPAGKAAVLDLRAPELTFEPFADAVRRLDVRTLPRRQVRMCGFLKGPVRNVRWLLGLDAIGRCVLVLGKKDIAIKCEP